jgi:hypothetical protein
VDQRDRRLAPGTPSAKNLTFVAALSTRVPFPDRFGWRCRASVRSR